jgi:hypothetical protein
MKNTIKIIIASIMFMLALIGAFGNVSALTIASVSISPESIEQGETSRISIEVENDADKDIKDVSVSIILDTSQLISTQVQTFTLPFSPIGGTEDGFDKINDGDSEIARFELQADSDAKAGNYKIPIIVSYNEDNIVKTRSSLISLNINSKPVLTVTPESGLLLKGQENKVTIKIVNKGLADAKFLEFEAGGSTNYNIIGTQKVYIGNIDSDDFDSIDFNIFIKPTSVSAINFPIIIKYKDSLNQEYTENFNIQLKAYSQQEAVQQGLIKKNNTFMIVLGVVITITLYIIYRRLKKRKYNKSL